MKTFKQFLDEAETTKVSLFRHDVGDDEEDIGADVKRGKRPMEPPHRQDQIKKIRINQTVRHEPEEKTRKDMATPESEKNIQGIMSDIKNKKQIEPILVRRQKGGSYLVMDGHHRLEAHLRMRLRHIPARIIQPQNVKFNYNEEAPANVSAGSGVRGFGDVSGTPTGDITNYAAYNASDTSRNDAVSSVVDQHNAMHTAALEASDADTKDNILKPKKK